MSVDMEASYLYDLYFYLDNTLDKKKLNRGEVHTNKKTTMTGKKLKKKWNLKESRKLNKDIVCILTWYIENHLLDLPIIYQ